MKIIISSVITTLFYIGSINTVNAQNYRTSLGLRVGSSEGVTVKHFLSRRSAFEGLITARWQGVTFTGLYELHQTAFREPNLQFYFGAGGHLGFFEGHPGHPWFFEDREDHVVVGVDGILGLEYTFEEIPLNLGLDWKPAFNIAEHSGLWLDNFALSVRFAFK